jgi:hypothetical protein
LRLDFVHETAHPVVVVVGRFHRHQSHVATGVHCVLGPNAKPFAF